MVAFGLEQRVTELFGGGQSHGFRPVRLEPIAPNFSSGLPSLTGHPQLNSPLDSLQSTPARPFSGSTQGQGEQRRTTTIRALSQMSFPSPAAAHDAIESRFRAIAMAAREAGANMSFWHNWRRAQFDAARQQFGHAWDAYADHRARAAAPGQRRTVASGVAFA